MRLAIPGIIELVPPALQFGAGSPEVVVAQEDEAGLEEEVKADRVAGLAASVIKGTATHPPSEVANKGARIAIARGKLEDRLVAGI